MAMDVGTGMQLVCEGKKTLTIGVSDLVVYGMLVTLRCFSHRHYLRLGS
jgi:hypothetical protein